MARQKGSRTGRCQGCNRLERVRIERLLAAGASIKGTAQVRDRLSYIAWTLGKPRLRRGPIGVYRRRRATKDQLEAVVADESLALIDHYRIVRSGLYRGFSAASELGDGNCLALLAGRLHEKSARLRPVDR
jgi:hypothetical protein